MTSRWHQARCLLTATFLATCPAQQPSPLTPEQREVFELFDEFDPLDTSRLPFVRVVTTRDGREWENFGFLQGASGPQLQVRYLDLGRGLHVAHKERRGEPGIAVAPYDMHEAVRRAVDAAHRRVAGLYDGFWDGSRVFWSMGDLLLARACAQRGLDHDLQQLWEVLPPELQSRVSLTQGKGGLAAELAWRLALDFTDPEYSWQDLLRRHDVWLATFPNSVYRGLVTEQRDGIAAVLAAKAQRSGAAPGVAPSLADRVFALRDEFYEDLHSWDSSSVAPPGPPPTTGSTPAEQLVALGLAAVPALIDALDDHDLTRCVVDGGRMRGNYEVQTVGRVAAQVLVEIAGVRVPSPQLKANWQEWFAKAQKVGARRIAEERIAARDFTAVHAFLHRWPDGLETVLPALRAARHTPTYLLEDLWQAAGKRSGRVSGLCRQWLLDTGDWRLRLEIADSMLAHGDRDGVQTVLDTWWRRNGRPQHAMLSWLVDAADAHVWRTIEDACALPVVRASLAGVVAESPARRLRDPLTADAGDALPVLRRCLLLLLDDDASLDDWRTVVQQGRRVALFAPTVADVAAAALNELWPDEFAFDAKRTASERRRQILSLRGTPAVRPANSVLPPDQVRAVEIDDPGAVLPATVRERLCALRGQTMTASLLFDHLVAAVAAASGHDVRLVCERPGDGSGTVVRFALHRRGYTTDCWHIGVLAVAGGEVQVGESVAFNSKELVAADQIHAHGDHRAAIDAALARAPAVGVEILLTARND